MDQSCILYPDQQIPAGQLYHNRNMEKIEAFIPTLFNTNHAAYLLEASNGDLLCAWFAGSEARVNTRRVLFGNPLLYRIHMLHRTMDHRPGETCLAVA